MKYIQYLFFGTIFGFVLMKAEVISWFRIQEMFRFQSFHMYGIIGSAIVIGVVSIWIIKHFSVHDISGKKIRIEPKDSSQVYRYAFGGIVFGLGWALTGACPGPIFALLGSGVSVFIVVLFSALIGTYTYAYLQKRLPH